MSFRGFLIAVFALCFLLRIFWLPFVWADEGLWFTTAQEILRGKVLYRDVWFDKPPGLALVYALLFSPGVAQLAMVRVFAIFYAAAVALLLWHMGRTFWGEREGQIAALAYAFYNATYFPSQMQPLAGDHLMLLPYLGSGYLLLRGRPLWGGLLASLAFQISPKSAVLLLWAAVLGLRPFGQYVLGFVAGTLPWAGYLAVGRKWESYLQDFWGWGFTYLQVNSPQEWISQGLRRILSYGAFHAPLFVGLFLYLREKARSHALVWWLAVSFLGVAAGGRFYARYFFQVLPLLCLLAARGFRNANVYWRYAMLAGLLVSGVRFHTRTVVLAYETVTGKQTAYMANWSDTAMDRGSREIARHVALSLFVWGYRPEIYFYCDCLPASRYLSSQPLTGVPADIHLRESKAAAPELAAENRARLAAELTSQPPDFIVDGLGPYNPQLAMEQYPELRAVLYKLYVRQQQVGQGWIYRRNKVLFFYLLPP